MSISITYVGGVTQALSSVTNAVRVLKSFSSTSREWGVSDLARELDISKSTVHRLLVTLAEEGMLEQNSNNGKYRLGLAVFDLAAAVPTQLDLHEAVMAPMTDLRNRTGETVQLAVLDNRHVVYIERLDSPNTLRTFLDIGRRNSAHCCGTGKALLAFSPRSVIDPLLKSYHLEAKTSATITSMPKLQAELDLIRKRGYAENRHESETGVVSVAAPVRDGSGRTIAAISVAGPADRMDPCTPEMARATMMAAASASKRLGFRGMT